MTEKKEGNDALHSAEGTRDKIVQTLDHVQKLGKFQSFNLDLETKVICQEDGVEIRWNSHEYIEPDLCITFFVQGVDEPITVNLSEWGDGGNWALLDEDELGFNPTTTPFNYMIHPETTVK